MLFSDAVGNTIRPGKREKSFFLADRESCDISEKTFCENKVARLNKKREGRSCPHVHLIENKHVEEVLVQLHIYKK